MLGQYLGAGSSVSKGIYHLDGNANDASGNGNNGTASNITWVGGNVGSGAASFNGSTSYINLGNKSLFSSSYTISCIVEPTLPSSGTYDMICTKWGPEGSTTGFYYGFHNVSGIQRIDLVHFAGGTFTELFWTPTLVSGNTYYITLTWNGATSSLYINGNLISGQANSRGCTNGTHNFSIGMSSDLSSHGYGGNIDELIIENSAWSAQEVKKYYTYSKGKFGIL